MKFSCTQERLSQAVAVAERFTGKNINLPILGNILIDFLNNSIRITATNLEHAVQLVVDGIGKEGGSITIPAKIATPLLGSIKENNVEIEAIGDILFVRTQSRETKVNGAAAQDFPLIPRVKKNKEFILPAEDIGVGLRSVLPAVSQSEFKPELCGVLWRVTPVSLRLVATDTFRLAEKTIPFAKKNELESFSFIIPSKTTTEISRVFDSGVSGNVLVAVDDNQVMFDMGGMQIISRVIEGKFPDYDAVIPKNHETTCVVSRHEIHDAIRGSSIFVSKLQDVSIRFKRKTMEVASANNEVGEYKTKTTADVQGKDLQVNFNYRYILDALGVLQGDEIFLGCNTEQSPVLLRNTKNNTVLYIVMPIKAI